MMAFTVSLLQSTFFINPKSCRGALSTLRPNLDISLQILKKIIKYIIRLHRIPHANIVEQNIIMFITHNPQFNEER